MSTKTEKLEQLIDTTISLAQILNDDNSQRRLFWRAFEISRLLDAGFLDEAESYQILDYGCGSAIQSLLLAVFFKKVIATDVDWRLYGSSSNNISHTQHILSRTSQVVHNIEFAPCGINQLPFEDGYFDYVYSSYVLEHVKNRGAYLCECRRVLRPGARFMMIIPAPGAYIQFIRRWFQPEYTAFTPHGEYDNCLQEFWRYRHASWRSLGKQQMLYYLKSIKVRPVWGEMKFHDYNHYYTKGKLTQVFRQLQYLETLNHAFAFLWENRNGQ